MTVKKPMQKFKAMELLEPLLPSSNLTVKSRISGTNRDGKQMSFSVPALSGGSLGNSAGAGRGTIIDHYVRQGW